MKIERKRKIKKFTYFVDRYLVPIVFHFVCFVNWISEKESENGTMFSRCNFDKNSTHWNEYHIPFLLHFFFKFLFLCTPTYYKKWIFSKFRKKITTFRLSIWKYDQNCRLKEKYMYILNKLRGDCIHTLYSSGTFYSS